MLRGFFGTPERDRTATTASGGLGTIHYATGARRAYFLGIIPNAGAFDKGFRPPF